VTVNDAELEKIVVAAAPPAGMPGGMPGMPGGMPGTPPGMGQHPPAAPAPSAAPSAK
jgi:hypothetical protein